ncbi:MAG: sigma-70 family RNA polymerase sigma factor [Oscillospiraceae bacterium]|nr:sigma-70 family RNA polymerase sigma factor [Oscillospiraceae bacterium]
MESINSQKTHKSKTFPDNHEELEKLYKETYKMVYYTAYSIMRNETDAQDIMQNSYISAFTKLDQLKDPSAFVPWLKKIVINNCKNMLKSRKPNLFNTEDDENSTLDSLAEQSESFLPENYIIQETKRQQLMDIINRLSELQRTTILLFYYDELSIKEIAEVMECSESTVTSRISYAKKFIKREVELLEKKGDKIYAAAPLPFLAKLFLEDAKTQNVAPSISKSVWGNLVAGFEGTASGTPSIVAKLSVKFAALSLTAKCVTVGTAAAVVIAALAAPIIANAQKDKGTEASPTDLTEAVEDVSVTMGPDDTLVSDEPEVIEPTAEQAVAYYEVLNSIIGKYGVYIETKTIAETQALDWDVWQNSSGLAYAQLIDFDGDGIQELYFYYLQPESYSENGDSPVLTEEVWLWDGAQAVQAYSEAYESNGSNITMGKNRFISVIDGKTYLMSSGNNMYGTGMDEGIVGVVQDAIGAAALEKGKFIDASSIYTEIDTYSDESVIYSYSISENGNVVDSGDIPVDNVNMESDDWTELATAAKQWYESYQVEEGFSNLLMCGGHYIMLGWVSNDVNSLMSALMSAGGPAMALQSIPYIGDVSKCKMSAEQAKAYIEVLQNAEVELGNKYEKNYAVLIDASGDGVPLLLIWAGSADYEWNPIEYQYWGFQNGAAMQIYISNYDTSLATWNGTTYFCESNSAMALGQDQSYVLYQVKNGAVTPAHTIKLANGQYTFDGESISEEQFFKAIGEIQLCKLIGTDDIVVIGDEFGGEIYKTLMQASISQTMDMLSNALPALG